MACRIYIVEDDPDIGCLYTSALKNQGFNTTIFGTSESCIESLAEGNWPDALICDQKLPGLSGLECIRQAREMGIECPAIIITGARTKEMSVQGISIGVQAILDKPCDITEVIHHLKKLISQHKTIALTDKLLSELSFFGQCAESLVSSYKQQIKLIEKENGTKKKPPLKLMIMKRESDKWEKELLRTKGNTDTLRSEYQRLKDLIA